MDFSLTGATVTGLGFAGVDLGRSRLQSEFRAIDQVPAHASGWLNPDHFATGDNNSPPGANQFTLGTIPSDTATNLQTALTTAITGLTQTALPAASAMAAANDFFGSDPPLRVNGPPPIPPPRWSTAPLQIPCFGIPVKIAHAGAPDRDRPGRSHDDHRLWHARQRAGDHHPGRQCRRARRDDLFGERSERPGNYQALSQEVTAISTARGTQQSAISKPTLPTRRPPSATQRR